MPTLFRAPLGISDFRQLRELGATYVDKTGFVERVLEAPAIAMLFPRPRRFGKTLNLSTLRHFVEKSDADAATLFEGTQVWSSEPARRHFQRYPVIELTFKDVKPRRWNDCLDDIRQVIAGAFRSHRKILEADGEIAETAASILAANSSLAGLKTALRWLSDRLAAHYGERVVILIDEYDTPIHAGFTHGYYEDVIEFFRSFLSGGLKDNPHLFKGVLTGILRVAKESIFSGLNNLAVYSLLRPEFAADFGFTPSEVEALGRAAGAESTLPALCAWYDGYRFGAEAIYNPWSVLSFLDSADRVTRDYWVSTSSDDILRRLLTRGGLGDASALETLLAGDTVEREVREDIVLRDVEGRPDAAWSFLLFSGYLTPRAIDGKRVRLAIPNREVESVFRGVFRRWLGEPSEVDGLIRSLLDGDAEGFEAELEALVTRVMSYHDAAGAPAESVYQAFIVGLLVHMAEHHEVKSNREAGRGRADVLVIPKRAGQPGAVLELKRINRRRGETETTALDAACAQIIDRDYAAALRERGALPIRELAVAFEGKRVWARVVPRGS